MTREQLKKELLEATSIFKEVEAEYSEPNTIIDSGNWYYISHKLADLITRQNAYIDELEKIIARETNIDIEVPTANRHFAYLDAMESGAGDNQELKELLPCPFCNSDIKEAINDRWNPPLKILRTNCSEDCLLHNIAILDNLKSRTNWNTRVPSKQLTTTQQSLDTAVIALTECAEELKAELDARYYINDGDVHPAMKSRYEREMSTVYKAKAALASIKE